MHKLFRKHTSVAVLSAAMFAAAGLAHAASPTQPESSPAVKSADQAASHHRKGDSARHGKHARGHAYRGGYKHGHKKDVAMWLPGYGPVPQRVVDSLELNDEQRSLLDKARESTKNGMQRRARDSNKTASKADAKQDKAPALDPHARIKERAAKQAQFQEQRADITQKWLALWDSLDNAQQEKLSAHMAERVAKRTKHRDSGQARRVDEKAVQNP